MESEIKILDENSQLKEINNNIINELDDLNESYIDVKGQLPNKVQLSVYYPKLKQQLHTEIISFCREKIELKEDLNMLRMLVGDFLDEKYIRDYLETLQAKYNNNPESYIGILYHIEATRIDYGVSVTIAIKRTKFEMKQFVFRFRKRKLATGMDDVNVIGIPLDALKGGK